MICNVCGYAGDDFSRSSMGALCCPSCGAQQPETETSSVGSQSVTEYAAMLQQLVGATYTDQPKDEFVRLDAWGKKNAEFLNQFPPDTTYRALWCSDKYHPRPKDWSDNLWRREVQRRVYTEGNRSPGHLPPAFDGDHVRGFEVVYAAGSVLEFRLKLKKGVWMSDGNWHSYLVPCRFIDGDVRPLMDGQLMKPSFLLKTQKVYHYSK